MTERDELQRVIVAKLREHADFLKHNIATWQLLAKAADEIEQLKAALDEIIYTDGDPRAIATKALGWVRKS